MELKDDSGSIIRGSVDVQDRKGSIEITAFSHNLSLPTNVMTGKITGKIKHSLVLIQKEFYSSFFYFYKDSVLEKRLSLPNLSGITLMTLNKKQNILIYYLKTFGSLAYSLSCMTLTT